MRGDVFPDGVGFGGKQFVHGGGLLFAGATAHIGADGVGREVLRRAMQPAGQDGTVRELPGILRQGHERALRHVLGQVRVANHAQRGGIDEVNVPAHQFGKRRFGAALGVIAQELLVGQTVHSLNSTRRRSNRTGNVASGSLPVVTGASRFAQNGGVFRLHA